MPTRDYEALARHLPMGVLLFDEHGVCYANDEAGRLMRARDPSELLGLQPFQFYERLDAEAMIARRRLLEASGPGHESVRIDRIVRLDGTVLEVELRTSMVELDGTGHLAQTIIRDLSTLAEKQRRQLAAERQYASLVANVSVGVVEADYTALFDEFERLRDAGVDDLDAILDPALQRELGMRVRYLDANAAFYALLGATSLRDLTASVTASVTPQILTTFRSILVRWWSGTHVFREEFEMRRLDGGLRVVQMEVALPATRDEAARVPVSFTDITELRRAEKAAAQSELEMRALVDAAPLAIGRTLPDGTLTYANPYAIEMLGLDPTSREPVSLFDITHELDRDVLRRQLHKCVTTGTRVGPLEKRCKPADERPMWSRITLAPLLDDQGICHAVIVLAEDITESRRDREALAISAAAVHGTGEGVIVFDTDRKVRSMNPAAEDITGFAADEVASGAAGILASNLDQATLISMFATLEERGTWRGEMDMRRADGTPIRVSATVRYIESGRRADRLVLVVFSDVTHTRRVEERVAFLESYDELTGLPNRAHLATLLERPVSPGQRRAVLMIDIDRFAAINDSLGHDVGDELLREAARRLSKALMAGPVVARHGGDEYVVLADVRDTNGLHHVIQAIRDAFNRAYEIEGHRLFVHVSIGVAVAGSDEAPGEELLRASESAMFRAKSSYSDVAWFTPDLASRVKAQYALEAALHTAIEDEQLEVHYQPQIALSDGALVGAEALVRWRHPERGLVPPSEFVPVAERSGLIEHLGRFVLFEACRQASQWRANRVLAGRVAVNLSARQLVSSSIVHTVTDALSAAGLDASGLELEVTESMLMENLAEALTHLAALRDLGVRLAIDDFGTGYSSLAYLTRLPISRLKIDRSFIAGIAPDTADAPIVDAVLALAESLGLAVVAEGVETDAQERYLLDRGCARAQGFLYGRPMPAADFEAWTTKRGLDIRSSAIF